MNLITHLYDPTSSSLSTGEPRIFVGEIFKVMMLKSEQNPQMLFARSGRPADRANRIRRGGW